MLPGGTIKIGDATYKVFADEKHQQEFEQKHEIFKFRKQNVKFVVVQDDFLFCVYLPVENILIKYFEMSLQIKFMQTYN